MTGAYSIGLCILIWEIVLRTAVVYLFILSGLRLAGKREIGQMTVFDLVVLLLLANGVQNAMVGPDTSLTGGLLAAATLLILNRLVSEASLRWPRLRRMLEGTPTLLVLHGESIPQHMRQEGVSEEELKTALREHDIVSLKDVEMAVLEIDGSISIVPTDQTTKRIKRSAKGLRHQ